MEGLIVTSENAANLKRAAAVRALDFVQNGMKLGLGTDTTAEAFLDVLAPRIKGGLTVTAAATSERTAIRAKNLGIPVVPLEQLTPLDLTVDGADEADRALNLIKGGGGALLREKIVACASRRMIVVADGSKLVRTLGRFPLAVEVETFAHAVTLTRINRCIADLGYTNVAVTLRMADASPFRTDGGNVIYDCAFGAIRDAEALAFTLKSITGVVEHGLFIGLAGALVIAHRPDEVEVIERAGDG